VIRKSDQRLGQHGFVLAIAIEVEPILYLNVKILTRLAQ